MIGIFKFLLFIFTTLLPFALAQEEKESESKIVLQTTLESMASSNELTLLIHKSGHVQNRPYVIQVLESCNHQSNVIDSFSVCDVAKNFIDFDKEKRILTLLVREPKAADDETQLTNSKPNCLSRTKIIRTRLYESCNKSND